MQKEETTQDPVTQAILCYIREAEEAKTTRMQMNKENYDCYNLNQDWSHKIEGQSTEFLAKQQMAVEQITSFLVQGLVDLEEWFDVEYRPDESAEPTELDPLINKDTLKELLKLMVKKIGAMEFTGDSIKMGLLGALMICKVHGVYKAKSKFKVERLIEQFGDDRVALKKVDTEYWCLVFDLVRQEDFFIDPTGRGLYRGERIEIDYFQLLRMAKEDPDTYNLEGVKSLRPNEEVEQKHLKSRETNQDPTITDSRHVVTIYEFWGTFVNPYTQEVIAENAVCAITKDGTIVRKLDDNPFWHGEDPYVVSPIVRVPKSVWHRALMDAATKFNLSLNELFNLMVDGGLMSVHGIKQIREHWLDDPDQYADGIPPGASLRVAQSCPPGAKVLERVDTGTLSGETFNMFGLVDKEFMTSSMTNDVRMGNLPERNVKATEIVASNQTITGIFNGMVKGIEQNFFTEVLRKGLLTTVQHIDKIDIADLRKIFGKNAPLIQQAPPEEVFALVANGSQVSVSGLTQIMNRITDFRKITTLLQTISASPELINEFMKRFSFTKMMLEIVKSLGIEEKKIELDPEEKQEIQREKALKEQMMMMEAQGKNRPDKGSQVPDASKMTDRSEADNLQSQFQQDVAGSGETGL